MSELPAATQSDMLEHLRDWGFVTNPHTRRCTTAAELVGHWRDIEAQRASLGYDIDGMVYKIDRLDWQNRLGSVDDPRAGLSPTNFRRNRRRRAYWTLIFRWGALGR